MMLIGYHMLKTQNPRVVMCSHYEEQQSHGNPQNKLLFLVQQWNLSL